MSGAVSYLFFAILLPGPRLALGVPDNRKQAAIRRAIHVKSDGSVTRDYLDMTHPHNEFEVVVRSNGTKQIQKANLESEALMRVHTHKQKSLPRLDLGVQDSPKQVAMRRAIRVKSDGSVARDYSDMTHPHNEFEVVVRSNGTKQIQKANLESEPLVRVHTHTPKSLAKRNGRATSGLPPAMRERVRSHQHDYTGKLWREAAQQAGLDVARISRFGQSIPKFTASEANQLMAEARKGKSYRYNFVGSVCNDTGITTMFNVVGFSPARAKRRRRLWAILFAKANFSHHDFLHVSDASLCNVHAELSLVSDISLGPIRHEKYSNLLSGVSDNSVDPMEQRKYLNLLAASNFTLCPGGDEPWSMRVYEAAGAGSIPLITSKVEDLSAGTRGDLYGHAIQAVQDLFHVGHIANPIYSEEMTEQNRRIFIKYHTFIEGDNVPPDWDASLETNPWPILNPPREVLKLNRRKKEDLCIDDYREGLNKIRDGLGNNLQNGSFEVIRSSERPLVLGAGFGTTGTRSVMAALELLGLNVWHCRKHNGCNVPAVTSILAPNEYMDLFAEEKQRAMTPEDAKHCLYKLSKFDYTSLPSDLDAILDTPVAEVFLYLLRSFPNANVILTRRNSSEWVARRIASHNFSSFAPLQNPCGQFIQYPAASSFSKQQLQNLYDMHTDFVRCLVPSSQLLDLNVVDARNEEKEQLMPRLAKFLNRSVPQDIMKKDFPWVSTPND